MIIDCKNKLICFLALPFFSIPTFAANGHGYIGGSIAASFAQLGNNSPQITYFSGSRIRDNYPLKNNHPEAAVLGGNGGYEFTGTGTLLNPSIDLGAGIYGDLSTYHYTGHLIETAAGDRSNTLYDYKFHLTSMRVLAEIQLNWMLAQLSPFFNFGLGSSWNRVSGYHETAVTLNGYPPLQPFRAKTNEHFAYQVGAGVSSMFRFSNLKSAFPQERISVGYRYVNLGSTSFGTRGSAYPHRLNMGLLQTNEVYLNYTHFF